MFDKETIKKIKEAKAKWKAEAEKTENKDKKFVTISSEPVDFMSTPDRIDDMDYFEDINFPGEYPYTRGVH
ncbi:MAG TPA: methylmalonyl-CoA mutase, partial [candidate division Zixibacteria bacterium]|nr:methylmalonyl-CoA mutase [candidate division Zixibacteria bacterium]